MWLLVAWLLFGSRLVPEPDGGAIEGRLHELSSLVGEHVVLAALGLVAILIGGIAPPVPVRAIARRIEINDGHWKQQTLCWLFGLTGDFVARDGDFNLWLHRVLERTPHDLEWDVFKRKHCPPIMRSWGQDASENPESIRMGHRIVPKEPGTDGELWFWLYDIAEASIERELDSGLPMQLQIEREALYNDFDRVRAESELRAAIVVPLLVLVVILAVGGSPWWLVALLVPAWLLRQGVQAHVEAQQRLQAAVRHEVIKSPSVEFVRSLHEGTDAPRVTNA